MKCLVCRRVALWLHEPLLQSALCVGRCTVLTLTDGTVYARQCISRLLAAHRPRLQVLKPEKQATIPAVACPGCGMDGCLVFGLEHLPPRPSRREARSAVGRARHGLRWRCCRTRSCKAYTLQPCLLQPRLMHGEARDAVDRTRYGLDGWAHYAGQRGQVLVFRDVVLRQALRTDVWYAFAAVAVKCSLIQNQSKSRNRKSKVWRVAPGRSGRRRCSGLGFKLRVRMLRHVLRTDAWCGPICDHCQYSVSQAAIFMANITPAALVCTSAVGPLSTPLIAPQKMNSPPQQGAAPLRGDCQRPHPV